MSPPRMNSVCSRPRSFCSRVAHTLRLHELVMHDVQRGFAREVAVTPRIRPGAAVVDGAARRRRELSDLIDLHVGLFGAGYPRIRRLTRDHALPRRRALDLAFGEHRFGQHRMKEDRSARRLRPEDLAVPGDVETPRVAAAAAVLLERAAIWLEAHDAAAVAAEGLRAVGRRDVADAVAVRRVDPAVESPSQVVDHRMRVEGAKSRVQPRPLVGDLIAVGVLEIPEVW